MRDAISNVLETMFFLSPEFSEGRNLRAFQQWPFFLESSITIASKVRALRLVFRVTKEFAGTITANFLGVEQEEVPLEEMEDTLKELANMVGGDCLVRLPADNWELGIPKIEQPKADADAYFAPEMCTVVVSWDDRPMAVIHSYVEQ
jgi:CheY-specific phosphatase CheX